MQVILPSPARQFYYQKEAEEFLYTCIYKFYLNKGIYLGIWEFMNT